MVQIQQSIGAHVEMRELLDGRDTLRHALQCQRCDAEHAQVFAQLHKVDWHVRQWIHRQIQAHHPLSTAVYRHRNHGKVHALQIHVLVRLILVLVRRDSHSRCTVSTVDEAKQETQILPAQLIQPISFRVAGLDESASKYTRRTFGRRKWPVRAALI